MDASEYLDCAVLSDGRLRPSSNANYAECANCPSRASCTNYTYYSFAKLAPDGR